MKLGVRIDRKPVSPDKYVQVQLPEWEQQIRKAGIGYACESDNGSPMVGSVTAKGKESVFLDLTTVDITQWLLSNHAGKFPAADRFIKQHGYLHATVCGEPYIHWDAWYCTHTNPLRQALELRERGRFEQEVKAIAALLRATLNELRDEFSLELKSYCWQYNLLGAVYG